jgi:hypothetical protein
MVLPMTVLQVNVRISLPPIPPGVLIAGAMRRFSPSYYSGEWTIPYFSLSVHGKTVAP